MLHWLGALILSAYWPESGKGNAFFASFGSVLIPPLLGAAVVGAGFWWHNQCGVRHCYWYARRRTAANERACFLHHPHKRRTVADIHRAHVAALAAPEPGPAPAAATDDSRKLDTLHADLTDLTHTLRAVLLGQHQHGSRSR